MRKIVAPSLALIASAAVVFLAACSTTDSPVSPSSMSALGGVRANVGTLAAATVQVCVDPASPLTTYTFTATNPANFQTGDATTSPVVINTAVAGPVCGNILTRTPAGSNATVATVTINATTAAAGTFSWVCSNDSGGATCLGGASGTGPAAPGSGEQSFHGSSVAFTFVPTAVTGTGCTYTQGYWKNKGKAAASAYTFFGQNALTILNTAPKGGNVYLILAHQYIAVTLNVNNGASLSGDALTAYNAATTYFGLATVTNTVPSGYTASQITALATVLDNYNNGLIGPGHCGTEVIA